MKTGQQAYHPLLLSPAQNDAFASDDGLIAILHLGEVFIEIAGMNNRVIEVGIED